MREKYIIANWKANPGSLVEAKKLVTTSYQTKSAKAEIILAVPSVYLSSLNASGRKIAAQDFFREVEGPYTSQITLPMLKSLKINYVIIGHSEVKLENGDTNEEINKKIHFALSSGVTPIICLGEKIASQQRRILKKQFTEYFKNISEKYFQKIILCYEPVWAISKGKKNSAAATDRDIERVMLFLRKLISQKYSKKIAEEISIIYGGSINDKNAKEIFQLSGVDGGLVGSASLDGKKFVKIIKVI